MSRPASIRPQRGFIGKNKKQGSKKLEIDWDQVHPSYNHRMEDELNFKHIQRLRRELIEAERLHRDNKAKKIRREINRSLEQGLSIQATWCGSCLNVLHRCQCPTLTEVMEN